MKRECRGKNHGGFTLLELLVALAIFALMAVAIYSSLGTLLRSSARLDEEGGRLKELQAALRLLERDLDQVADRPVRSTYDEELPPLSWPGLENRLEFTANGRANPRREPRCSLQRLAYQVKDGQLWRLSWAVLDQAPDSAPFARPLLSGVKRFEVSFLTGDRQTVPSWPPEELAVAAPPLPKAIRVVLEVEGWGRLERLFLPAGGK